MTDEWYYDKESGFASDARRLAHKQYEYFSNKDNGYIEGDAIKITSPEQLDELYKRGIVEEGDLLYWDFTSDGDIDHASIISSTDGELKYTAHTSDVFDESVKIKYIEDYPNATLHIIPLKKNVPEHDEPSWLGKLVDQGLYYLGRFWDKLTGE